MGFSKKYVILLCLNLFSYLGVADVSDAVDNNPDCLEQVCTYMLINSGKYKVEDLIKDATQALTGKEHQRLNPQSMWIGPGTGHNSSTEIKFYANDPVMLTKMLEVIPALDMKYNKKILTPIRVTAQIYAVDEDALKDISFGIDGVWRAKNFDKNLLVNQFLPTPGAITGIVGSLPDLLRIQLNAVVEKGRGLKIEDRSRRTFHGSEFNFSDTQDYYRDGPVNTDKGVLGFELSGKIFIDNEDPNNLIVSDLQLYIGFAPTENQNKLNIDGNRSPFGVRKIELPYDYERLISGMPTIISETIVYAHYDDSSFGLFTGVKNGGEASRLIVILTAEVNPEQRPAPDFSKETPEQLRNSFDRKKGKGKAWHENTNDGWSDEKILWFMQ